MLGRDSSPMVTTVAPTIPVLAASSAPTATTEMPRPPRSPAKTRPMLSSSSSATRDFSSTTPIMMNSGTAISVTLDRVPNSRPGSAVRNAASKPPNRMPPAAKSRAVPASVKATG